VTEVDDRYVMGRTQADRARLSQQDRIFAPHSENLFRQAGIIEGMRVVDVGCGVGDTTRLLARIVGPAGSVIGVDQDAASLEAAERIGAGAGLSNVTFQQRTLPDIDLDAPADALAGRGGIDRRRRRLPGPCLLGADGPVAGTAARSTGHRHGRAGHARRLSQGADRAGTTARGHALHPRARSGLGARAVNDRLATGDHSARQY
jgi:SAM-dependent methyltransferase